MASPIGGRLSEAFKAAYLNAGVTQVDIETGLHDRGFTNVDQPLVSKWARGMRTIPIDVLPALDEICGLPLGGILRRAGYVDDNRVDVPAAIMADPQLSAEAKRILVGAHTSAVRGADISPTVDPELEELAARNRAKRRARRQASSAK